MAGCLFCDKDDLQKNRVIFENELLYARWDNIPITPGHAEIVPKRHIASLLELSMKEWLATRAMISETIVAIESTNLRELYNTLRSEMTYEKAKVAFSEMLNHVGIDKKPDAYNFGVNDGEAAGRTVHHLHIHIIPRYIGDVENPRGGVRNIIPGKGNY